MKKVYSAEHEKHKDVLLFRSKNDIEKWEHSQLSTFDEFASEVVRLDPKDLQSNVVAAKITEVSYYCEKIKEQIDGIVVVKKLYPERCLKDMRGTLKVTLHMLKDSRYWRPWRDMMRINQKEAAQYECEPRKNFKRDNTSKVRK